MTTLNVSRVSKVCSQAVPGLKAVVLMLIWFVSVGAPGVALADLEEGFKLAAGVGSSYLGGELSLDAEATVFYVPKCYITGGSCPVLLNGALTLGGSVAPSSGSNRLHLELNHWFFATYGLGVGVRDFEDVELQGYLGVPVPLFFLEPELAYVSPYWRPIWELTPSRWSHQLGVVIKLEFD